MCSIPPAPLSEMFGRRNVHLASYLPFAVRDRAAGALCAFVLPPEPPSPLPQIFHLGCGAARNIETLIVCRFFAGTFGSAPLTNSGGVRRNGPGRVQADTYFCFSKVISDIFAARERALALSLFAPAPYDFPPDTSHIPAPLPTADPNNPLRVRFMGPVLGPIIGGFIGENTSWRWL